jgi:Ca2+/Na+ antiporter
MRLWKFSTSKSECLPLLTSALALVVVGYGVSPLLFGLMDQAAAGRWTGRLLSALNMLVALVLLAAFWIHRHRHDRASRTGFLFVTVGMILASEFWLKSKLQTLKSAHSGAMTPLAPNWTEFAMWHGVYQLLMVAIILALLVWWWRCLTWNKSG